MSGGGATMSEVACAVCGAGFKPSEVYWLPGMRVRWVLVSERSGGCTGELEMFTMMVTAERYAELTGGHKRV